MSTSNGKEKLIELILVNEHENTEKNFKNLLKAYYFICQNLKEDNINLFLTAQFLIEINNIILEKNNTTLRMKQVKPAGYNFQYMDYRMILPKLQTLTDNWNSRFLTPSEFIQKFLKIHPFLDGNGRTCKILFV